MWTLDGKPEKSQHESGIERKALESAKPGKQIVESEQQLTEIVTTIEQQWQKAFTELVQLQQKRGYKKRWIYYRIRETKPPLSIWQMCGEYLGYKPGWAFYQYHDRIAA